MLSLLVWGGCECADYERTKTKKKQEEITIYTRTKRSHLRLCFFFNYFGAKLLQTWARKKIDATYLSREFVKLLLRFLCGRIKPTKSNMKIWRKSHMNTLLCIDTDKYIQELHSWTLLTIVSDGCDCNWQSLASITFSLFFFLVRRCIGHFNNLNFQLIAFF